MEILNPSARFLRVSDKFFPEFIFMDDAVSRGPLLVYLYLFRRAYKSGACKATQVKIARYCKGSVRSVQHHLKTLAALKYISVEPQDDGCNVYRLLLSQRVKTFIAQAAALPWQWDGDDQQGAEFSSGHAQNLRGVGENSAPYIKSNKSNKNSPLSPLPTARSSETPSPRKPFLAASGQLPLPEGRGRGDSFHPVEKRNHTAAVAADDDFERLWAVWPVKKDKAVSRRIFLSKARMRRIPALSVLLSIVERFKAVDRHWRNNCAPLLSTWLRGDRWQDEPLEAAPGSSTGVQASSAPAVDARPARPLPPVLPRKETPEEKARKQGYGLAVADLQALCPAASRQSIHAALALAGARGIGFAALVARARAHLRGTIPDFSLVDWIKQGALA